MPILNYKDPLIEKVMDGSKIHTVRFSKRPWKIGDSAIHATGVRTKNYREHRRDDVTLVQPITICCEPGKKRLEVNGMGLVLEQAKSLSSSDGFESLASFFHFFATTYSETEELKGQLIHWSENPPTYSTPNSSEEDLIF